jgi:hypothetical protein
MDCRPPSVLPQITTLPSLRRAMLNTSPAAMAVTLFNHPGTTVSPTSLLPQATTVPSLRRASE